MQIFRHNDILGTKGPILLGPTSGCPQITTASRTETIKNRYPSYTESYVSKKQQILWSRIIASLAFRKLCWFASLLRRQQIIKTCREQQFCVHFKLPPQLPENKDLLQSSYVSFILPLDRTESTMNGCSRIVCVFITPRPQVTQN